MNSFDHLDRGCIPFLEKMLVILYQAVHVIYALAHLLIAGKLLFNNHIVRLLPAVLVAIGLAMDNASRALTPWLLKADYNDLNVITGTQSDNYHFCYKLTCVSYFMHDVSVAGLIAVVAWLWYSRVKSGYQKLPTVSYLSGDINIILSAPSPRVFLMPVILSMLAIAGVVVGYLDHQVWSRPCDDLLLTNSFDGIYALRYVPTWSHDETSPWPIPVPPPLFIIIVTLLAWIALSVRLWRNTGQFTSFWLFMAVLIGSGVFVPPGVGVDDSAWVYIKMIASNGVEVLFMYAINVCVDAHLRAYIPDIFAE